MIRKERGRKIKFDQVNPTRELAKSQKMSSKYKDNPEMTENLVREAFERSNKHRGIFKSIWVDMIDLFKMVSAWARGHYKAPRKVIIASIAAIVYFVNPFDFVPDFIPGVGYIDDLSVLTYLINLIEGDLQEFRKWKNENNDQGEI